MQYFYVQTIFKHIFYDNQLNARYSEEILLNL